MLRIGCGRVKASASRLSAVALWGGAFHLSARSVRCADRFDFEPVFRGDIFGFQAVASPLVFSDR